MADLDLGLYHDRVDPVAEGVTPPLRTARIAALTPAGRLHPAPTRTRGVPPLYRRLGKRCLDIVAVLVSLPLTLPLILFAALLLLIESGLPFYTQERLGRNGRIFRIVKLRTMVRDADAMLERLLEADPALRQEWERDQKLKKDPRITRIGAVLRSTSLDELPQLWNVLRGDMSLVGPRPMMPGQLPIYGDPRHYFALLPGITGRWQVTDRNECDFRQRAALDAEYDRFLSFVQDLAILLKTVGVVLRRTGY